jgi:SAM-dependent methyltransferase
VATTQNRSPMTDSVLTLQDFARLFGTTADNISSDCRAIIDAHDSSYRTLAGEERDHILLNVLKQIDANQFSLAGPEGKERWEKGWAENSDSFLESGGDASQLIPKYIRLGQPLRMDQTYVEPSDPNFELNWYEVFRLWLSQTYLADAKTVYEFGCGSGFNLAVLAQLYPDKRYFGLDWASSSVDIVNELGKFRGWDRHGHLFDFFSPDRSVRIEENSTVLTIGALEQTGVDYEPFLQYLLESSPSLCVNIEPIVEWYEEDTLVDYAAIQFHLKRNYWWGFPARLKELEQAGKVEILKAKRSCFGSLYIESYSQLIWRPI